MTSETQIQTIRGFFESALETDPVHFLVDLRIKPANNFTVFVDGDNGITIEKCVSINRAVYKMIEESGMFPEGDFSLEVSSPGLDEPLKLHRQYKKNIGRLVEVLMKDGSKFEGKLVSVEEDKFVVEETVGKNKKKETKEHSLLFENIKTTKIQVVF